MAKRKGVDRGAGASAHRPAESPHRPTWADLVNAQAPAPRRTWARPVGSGVRRATRRLGCQTGASGFARRASPRSAARRGAGPRMMPPSTSPLPMLGAPIMREPRRRWQGKPRALRSRSAANAIRQWSVDRYDLRAASKPGRVSTSPSRLRRSITSATGDRPRRAVPPPEATAGPRLQAGNAACRPRSRGPRTIVPLLDRPPRCQRSVVEPGHPVRRDGGPIGLRPAAQPPSPIGVKLGHGCPSAQARRPHPRMIRRQPPRETAWAWLRTVAIREAWHLQRREQREDALEAAHETGLRDREDPRQDPAIRDWVAGLQRAATLRPRQRRLVGLQAAGCSYAEIMEATGETYRTVDRQLRRARRRREVHR